MSIVVKCDRCEKELADDDERVILTAMVYTLYDPDNPPEAPAVDASQPPGRIVPSASTQQTVPMALTGSTRQFIGKPAFNGQIEMHLSCWEEWFAEK